MKEIYKNTENLKDKLARTIDKISRGNSIDNRWEKFLVLFTCGEVQARRSTYPFCLSFFL